MSTEKRNGSIVIIGGGVTGLCSAYYLRKKGFEVTIIEKGNFSDGCSYGNAGMIVPSHFIPLAAPGMIKKGVRWMLNAESPFYIRPRLSTELLSWGWKFYKAANAKKVEQAVPVLTKLNVRSKELFTDIIGNSGLDLDLQKKGLLMYCKTAHVLREEAEVAEQAVRLGMNAQVLDKSGIFKLEPHLETDVAGAVYFADDAFITPHRFMSSLLAEVKAMGVKIKEHVEAVDLIINAKEVKSIVADDTDIFADQFLVAAGAWSSGLVKGLNLKIPMQAGKGYSVTIPHPPVTPRICNILTEARVAVTPMSHGLRVAGTMEIAGNDLSINHSRVMGIYKSLSQYFPQFKDFDFSTLPVWAGLRPCSPDGLPFIGRFRNFNNLMIAAGHGMMGFSLGPITGKLISEIAADEIPEIDIHLLNPDRYN